MSMNRIIDGSSIFTGQDAGKDGIKKEFGTYYEIVGGTISTNLNQSSSYILTLGPTALDDTGLLPFYTQTVRINSASYVEDYDEWSQTLFSKFVPSAQYIDHFFIQPQHRCETEAVNNFEFYGYEILSKQVPPLSLLNIQDQDQFPPPFDPIATNAFLDQFSINGIETQKRSHVFMGEDEIENYSDLDVYNSYIKLRFDTSVPTQDINLANELFKETKLVNKLFSYFKRNTGTLLDFYADSLGTLAEVNVKDFTEFLQEYDLSILEEQPDEKFYRDFLEPSTFEAQFLALQMLSRVRNLITSRMRRSFESVILDNDACDKVLIGYKVEKFRENTNNPLQTIFIMSSKFKNYYDSLIAYDTVYNYKFTSIFMVIGNSYAYVNPIENRELGQIVMTFVNRPSVQFVELPILEEDMVVTDIPNPPPEVQFFNERGNKREIIIALDQATLVENSSPDNYPLIFNSDNNSQRKVFIQQKDTQIQFSTLYTSNIYEVYRVDKPPTSLADFEANLLTTIGDPGIRLTDNVFRDLIASQKKYYYLIRTLTNFGVHSNPAKIYELELIEDSDETYINFSEFKIETKKQIENKKIFKKFLQIKPNLSQVAFKDNIITDLTTPDTYDKSVIGEEAESLWGRRFKIRIKSKKTGKLIDLNVTFNLVDENNQPTN